MKFALLIYFARLLIKVEIFIKNYNFHRLYFAEKFNQSLYN